MMPTDKIRKATAGSAGSAWNSLTSKAKAASDETKSTAIGGLAGGAAATAAGTHVGIAAFGTAVSGAALLPVAVCVGVGAVAGYAGYKLYKDVKGRRTSDTDIQPSPPAQRASEMGDK
jgi:hypothetical protein